MAEGFDDGVVLDELLGVRVGELDRTAPAEEVLGRSDGRPDLGVDGVAPVRGQARDSADVPTVLSLANATASSAGAGLTASAGLTVVSTGAGTKGDTLTIEPRREGIFECEVFTDFACG